MPITAADIEAEHTAALASMTLVQQRACRRLNEARRYTAFRGRHPTEHLPAIFAREAAERNASAQTDAQQAA